MQGNQEKRSLLENIKIRFNRYKRVLNIARKPELDEFKTSLKVTSAGILLLGFIGFIIFLLYFLVVR
jgi:protein translocase SEC61 complex gamma subunit